MVTAVSLNPSIDRTIHIEKFVYGGLNRASSVRSDVGGKAVNVAITAASLGVQTECVGFLYNDNGRTVESRLILHGVATDFLWLDGCVRTNIKLLDASQGVVTEVNEPGVPVNAEQLRLMTELVCAHAQDSDYLVLNGSLPPGCPKDYYKTLIEAVEGLNCRCVLDAEGEALHQGVEAHPFLIKPNLRELEAVVGRPLSSLEDIKEAAGQFIDRGVEIVAVSMGDKGALIRGRDEMFYAPKMEVPVRSTVGAGDAMVAGLISGFLGEAPLKEAFRMGVACATASVMTEGTQPMEKAAYKELLGKMQIRRA